MSVARVTEITAKGNSIQDAMEEGVKRASEGHKHGEDGNMYEEEEVVIIAGALKYREMAVSEVMTLAREAYMISIEEKLSYKLIYDIFKVGYSRIPVFDKDKNDVVGLAKDLFFIDPEVSLILSLCDYRKQ